MHLITTIKTHFPKTNYLPYYFTRKTYKLLSKKREKEKN